MAKVKKLVNPFSTGSGGAYFEALVQSSYVVLMLTGGYAPCIPCWPVSKIKLQGKVDGFETDDLIVFAQNPESKEERKLLGQVKHSIAITRNNSGFGEVMQATWNDFNNSKVFTKGKDVIALITGPLTRTDKHVQWLSNHARYTNVDDFFRNVKLANFNSQCKAEKLEVIKHHLKSANGGNEVSNDKIYNFLKHFYLLEYDLGTDHGVILSLLYSHISQFQSQCPESIWGQVVNIVQSFNQNAGTITPENLPECLRDVFRQKTIKIPELKKPSQEVSQTDWAQHSEVMSCALLIGSWNENSKNDVEVVTSILGDYGEWLRKAKTILNLQDSPLTLKNSIWKIVDRSKFLKLWGSHILDRDLDTFKSLAVKVLSEANPAFELPTRERYLANISGKILDYSVALRKGIAEGLALIGNSRDALDKCSRGKVKSVCESALRAILLNADWIRWGSLNSLLPTIAEADPETFLFTVETALHMTPCPFDELFSQEGNFITGSNYLTGLLRALEGLAWENSYLVRVCIVLGELASHDPGGKSGNRPANSLSTILLPWLPQTLASVKKREVAVRTLIKERPDVAWNLIIQLLPGHRQTSSGSYKPVWRKINANDSRKDVTHNEYWQQSSLYAELAVSIARQNIHRLTTLIDNFDNLPQKAFDQLLEFLSSQEISGLTENKRLPVWDHLIKFTNKHRLASNAEWALPEESIIRIEAIAEKLEPIEPSCRYRPLFDTNFRPWDENRDWEEQQKKLTIRRDTAILELYQQKGVEGVIHFGESVDSPFQVGYALGNIGNDVFEEIFLPNFLDTEGTIHNALVRGFIWRCYRVKNGYWCDGINKSNWTPAQKGQFLACLPFTRETWNRASEWLQNHENEYWNRTGANAYQDHCNLSVAIEKLIEHGRPHAAINCLYVMLNSGQPIDTNQCIHALLAAPSSKETISCTTSKDYYIVKLIMFLQSGSSVNKDALFKIEWIYLGLLLDNYSGAKPQIQNRLASQPDFFCKVIRLLYRPQNTEKPTKKPAKKSRAFKTNDWEIALELLDNWKTPPGTQTDGTFSEERFTKWLRKVKALCMKSGHLEVAFINIGQVLIYAPADENDFWINRVVADALNDPDDYARHMRYGFRTGTYKSGGVYCFDPSGKTERDLAEQFRGRADETENEGFQRFAATLRELAGDYDKYALISEQWAEER